ncbi:MAG: GNAT family N-acetyltransferase [Deltaproteobacteria bacterium]|nr:GNAT family N-acetyltransferase [Deltaproteobacteria bacterium]
MLRTSPIKVRRARPADLPTLGRLGAALARAHHEWDPQRFFLREPAEQGYAWWLGKELRNPSAVILAAAKGRRVVGYAYGRIEPRDWNSLRDQCGMVIDLMVEPRSRGQGIGQKLAAALIEALQEMGAPRVVLQVASRNRDAQRFFRAMGFRPTLVEMALELDPEKPSRPRSRR